MRAGYVQRAIQLKAAVSEAERINRPLICWPEDIGHITPADLPLIDLQIAMKEFILVEREWRYSDEPLCLPTPGKAYAVVEEMENSTGTLMDVVTFRPKTAVECKCDEDRVDSLWQVARDQEILIELLGNILSHIADEFIPPETSYLDYPVIDGMLDRGNALHVQLAKDWERVDKNERDAGQTA